MKPQTSASPVKGSTKPPMPFRMGPGPGPGFHPGAVEHAKDAHGALRRLWSYLRRQSLGLVLIFLLVTVSTGLMLLGPYLMGRAIDSYIALRDLPGLMRMALLMLAVHTIMTLTTLWQSFLLVRVSQRVVREIRDELFNKLQSLPLRFFDARTHGELMSRLTNDVDNISNTIGNAVTQLFSGVLMIAGSSAMMLILSWRLAIVTMLVVPLMFFLTKFISSHTRQGFREQQSLLGSLNGMIEENITGARVVKAYCREERSVRDFSDLNGRLRAASTKAQTFALVFGPLMNVVNNMSNAAIVGTGGWMALKGWVTVGSIAAFINYAQQFGRPLNELANLINVLQSALAGAERVFQIMDEPSEDMVSASTETSSSLSGDVVFDDVSFSYVEGTPVLRDMSLHARPGQTIALIGPTGVGKTTIINLLMRFYDVDSGAIYIDGMDIRDWDRRSLRRQIGMVLQDTHLFSNTVAENIRYGRLDATDEEVTAAARLANADEFIRRLPEGYKTQLSERGSNLSQGQRQLLTIARAILANPSILILDEATSSVDTRTETSVQDALLRFMEGRTCFVIAHRLKTIRNADSILVLNEGRIVEQGTHDELIARQGFYYNAYNAQLA